eukprot:GHVU01126307.1.p1 GENE.GHVU01126307.1~~GHVU01126307.1.p1  ORF type:complete len:111 (+),score=9.91 GHVU01126307.1:1308-1640(+)
MPQVEGRHFTDGNVKDTTPLAAEVERTLCGLTADSPLPDDPLGLRSARSARGKAPPSKKTRKRKRVIVDETAGEPDRLPSGRRSRAKGLKASAKTGLSTERLASVSTNLL